MYKVKVYNSLFRKPYYWYLRRCLAILATKGKIQLKIIKENPPFKANYLALIYVGDFPIVMDAVDSCCLPPKELLNYSDFRLLKSNLSSEHRPSNWYPELANKIKPYIIGRAFNYNYDINELKYFKKQTPKYKVISFAGVGVYALETKTRLKVFDLFKRIFGNKCFLVFRDRSHFSNKEKAKFPEWNDYFKKYGKINEWYKSIGFRKYSRYIELLSQGEFSINTPGISKSQPFRCVDAVIANKCIISTKIYVDIWKDFPCVLLPICGFTGSGDWKEAEEILRNLDKVDQIKLKEKTKAWYNKYLSPEGFWNNQILKSLK